MRFSLKSPLFFLVIAMYIALTVAASAQMVVPTPENVSIAELLPKTEMLRNDADEAYNKINDLRDVTTIENLYTTSINALKTYQAVFKDLKENNSNDLDRSRTLSSNIKNTDSMIANALDLITARLNAYLEIKTSWQERQNEWKNRKENSIKSSQAIKELFNEVNHSFAKLNKLISLVEPNLVETQLKIIQLQRDIKKLHRETSNFSSQIRKNLFERNENPMYSKSFINELKKDFLPNFKSAVNNIQFSLNDFVKENLNILIIQILLIWLLASLLKYAQLASQNGLLLNKITSNYLSASIFCSLTLTVSLLQKIPLTIGVLYTITIFISVLRLASAIIESKRSRTLLYSTMSLLLLFEILEIISLPLPLFRIFTAFIGLLGFITLYRNKTNLNQISTISANWKEYLLQILNKIVIIIFAIIFIAQTFGYSNLSIHLLNATLKSLFTALTAWMFIIISDDILYLFLCNKKVQKISFIQKHSSNLVNHLTYLVNAFIIIISFSSIIAIWGVFDNASQALSQFLSLGFTVSEIKITMGLLVYAALALYITLCISWIIQRTLEEEILPKHKVEKGAAISVNRLVHYFFIILSIIIAFSTLGIGIQSFTVIFGALGIGVGFGLQNIVNNFASGLILLFERSIKVGDTVVVGGEWGTVRSIGLRATVIQTFDNSEMIVPNSDLVSSTVNNWTLSERKTRFVASVGVDYDSDIKLVTKLLLEAATNHPNVMKDPAPSVVFTAFADSSLNFDLRGWVTDIDYRASTKNEIMYEINRLFKENNIIIPFPQRDIHIKGLDKKLEALKID
ncbi:MAG: mechanosensitive ion channel [Candidatus Riflebacteria bacterium]|nr:mechanosensitive ion channel [Candidatus Riflebacteria bacterium]